jgi:hypothetical protein
MRMVKGIASAAAVAIGYIDTHYTPLFWALLALAALDLILNAGKEQKQFAKLGSAFVALGMPTLLATNMGNPELPRIIVALMVLVYIQVVFPQVATLISKIKFSTNKAVNAAKLAAAEAELAQVKAMLEQQAETQAKALTGMTINSQSGSNASGGNTP